mgnify:CR=1 FL=1
MKQYQVVWSIDMDAESPEEAAAMALIVMRDNDPANSATVFSVNDGKKVYEVDLIDQGTLRLACLNGMSRDK